MTCRAVPLLLCLLALSAPWACSSGSPDAAARPVQYVPPDQAGEVAGTGIESQDIVKATDLMARSISAVLDRRSVPPERRPTIGIVDVRNETRFDINTKILSTRIRVLLSKRIGDRVSFVARDRMEAVYDEHQKKETGLVTKTPGRFSPAGLDFFLTGDLMSLTTKTSKGQSDYVLYTFKLIDANTAEELWTDMAEVKKEGREDAAYR